MTNKKLKDAWLKPHKYKRSHFHLSLAIIFAFAVTSWLLISIQDYTTELELYASTPITIYKVRQASAQSPKPPKGIEGAFCGGIAPGAFPCNPGLVCKLDGIYPDAGGKCVKQ